MPYKAKRALDLRDVTYQVLLSNLNVGFHCCELVEGADGAMDDLRMVDCNSKFLEIFHFTRDQVLGRRAAEIWPNSEPFWFDVALHVAQTGQSVHFERISSVCEAHFDVYLYSPAEGIVAQFYQDISGRLRTQRSIEDLHSQASARATQLEEALRELDSFSYSVSHDLRAPVRHIASFAELLAQADGPALSERGRHYLETIQHAARDMGRLVDDFLAFAHSGRAEVRKVPTSMAGLVEGVLNRMAPECQGRAIRWEVAALPSAPVDPVLMESVFENLLGNAVKFTRDRTEAVIEIGCRTGAQEHAFFVRDNGAGFDPRYADKLFGVFQRLHTRQEFTGTGVGLANVQRIIQRHGGRIWAEGAVGRGATFHFTLPLSGRS